MKKPFDLFTKRTIPTALICCVILWFSNFTMAQSQIQPAMAMASTGAGPIAKVTPTSINFGNFPTFGLIFYQVTVQNIGTSNLKISNASLTLGPHTEGNEIFFLNLCNTSLAPARNCDIFVYYLAEELGKKSATLNIKDNAPDSPQKVTLTGTGVKSSR